MISYEKNSRTKGRLMLVDADLVYYVMEHALSRARVSDLGAMPERLATEYADFAHGYSAGSLMEQERQFERLWHKNRATKDRITQRMLQDIQSRRPERANAPYMCYCQDTVPKDGITKDIITCSHHDCDLVYFHRTCIKKLGFEKVSRWYCTSCEKKMKTLAQQTLRNLCYTDVSDEEVVDTSFAKEKV